MKPMLLAALLGATLLALPACDEKKPESTEKKLSAPPAAAPAQADLPAKAEPAVAPADDEEEVPDEAMEADGAEDLADDDSDMGD